MTLQLSSPAFEPRSRLPKSFTSFSTNHSPPLRWTGVPDKTAELALICEDLDARTPTGPFVHWLAYGIRPERGGLNGSVSAKALRSTADGLVQGRNSLLQQGYTGPNVPPRHGSHRYRFRLLALDAPTLLADGAGRGEFERATTGHILDEAQLVVESSDSAAATVVTWAGGLAKNVLVGQLRRLDWRVAAGVAASVAVAGGCYLLASATSRSRRR